MDKAKFKNGNWTLVWEDIGEGLSGEYDEKDPHDVPLLRATLFYKGYATADGSYCTTTPVDTSKEELEKISNQLFDKLPKELDSQMREGFENDRDQVWHFNDKIMQEWTWFSFAQTRGTA